MTELTPVQRRRDLRFFRRIFWTFSLIELAMRAVPVVILAFIVSLISDFGRQVDLDLFRVVAQIIPILTIATVIASWLPWRRELERIESMSDPDEEEGDDDAPAFDTGHDIDALTGESEALDHIVSETAPLVIALTPALIALATAQPTTFLTTATLLGLLLQLYAFASSHARQYALQED